MDTHIKKSSMVREMFGQIAPRYDLLNHALSLNVDKRWRRFVVKKVMRQLTRPNAIALDLCCGTGDLSLELGRYATTIGMDFCHPMLQIGLTKVRASKLAIDLAEGDALNVPAPSNHFEVITMAFGLRNLDSVDLGLQEIFRLLKPQGIAAILEFSQPQLPVFRQLFQFYFLRILPKIGNAISGSQFAYQYLPESVQNFPDQKSLAQMMRGVGFSNVEYYNLFGGIAALHTGTKP
ncbi:MAG: bifunctional demethylmenaquinone methyltransferase/2-methoxy-6-polyprenyl-1,4-benzoquinol methylase UbiE [Acidobacteriota bacterium]